jgi:hypothetical protein
LRRARAIGDEVLVAHAEQGANECVERRKLSFPADQWADAADLVAQTSASCSAAPCQSESLLKSAPARESDADARAPAAAPLRTLRAA